MKTNRTWILFLTVTMFVFLIPSQVSANKYDDAYKLYKQKNIKGAIPLLEEHCNTYPKDPRGGYLLAQCYMKTKQLDKAIERLKIVLEHHPEHDQSQYLMGLCLLKKNDRSGALKHFKAAVDAKGDSATYLYFYGTTLLAEKKTAEAAKVFEKAVAVAPNDPKVNLELARILMKNGDYQSAIPKLKIASKGRSTRSRALNYLGSAFLHEKNYSEAVKYLTQASQLKKNDPNIFYNLGIAKEGVLGKGSSPDDYTSIIETFQKAISIKADKAEYHYRLGNAYEKAARTIYEKSVQDQTIAKKALDLLAKAKSAYQAAIKLDPSSPAQQHISLVDQMVDNIKNPQIIEEEVAQ